MIFRALNLQITTINAQYDQESHRLRTRFRYHEDLEGKQVLLNATPAAGASQFANIPWLLL